MDLVIRTNMGASMGLISAGIVNQVENDAVNAYLLTSIRFLAMPTGIICGIPLYVAISSIFFFSVFIDEGAINDTPSTQVKPTIIDTCILNIVSGAVCLNTIVYCGPFITALLGIISGLAATYIFNQCF
jgi:hypothetical protein